MSWLNDSNQDTLQKYFDYKEAHTEDYEFDNQIFTLLQVDLGKAIKEQYVALKYCGLQPSALIEMPYYEWQMMLEEIKENMEQEKEAHEKEEGKQSTRYQDSKEYKQAQGSMKGMGMDTNRFSGTNMSSNLPRMGNMNSSGFKMPKF